MSPLFDAISTIFFKILTGFWAGCLGLLSRSGMGGKMKSTTPRLYNNKTIKDLGLMGQKTKSTKSLDSVVFGGDLNAAKW